MPILVAHFNENLGSEFCNNDWIICSLQVYYRQISSTKYLKCQNQPGEYKSVEIQKSWGKCGILTSQKRWNEHKKM